VRKKRKVQPESASWRWKTGYQRRQPDELLETERTTRTTSRGEHLKLAHCKLQLTLKPMKRTTSCSMLVSL
jgi:hypothetical protein